MECDNTWRSIMSEVTNTAIVSNDRPWTQATLPVKLGGLGMHSAVEVAPSAYLAPQHVSSALIQTILSVQLSSFTPISLDDALSSWSVGHDLCRLSMIVPANKSPGTS